MIALVAGATRGTGRGIAVELGAAGATVYCTGRSTRERRSEMNRPETIEETWRDAVAGDPAFGVSETPAYAGRAVAALATDPGRSRWSGRSVSSEELALAYGITDTDGSRPQVWRCITEVLEGGKQASPEDYR